jgi:hypothetical protein
MSWFAVLLGSLLCLIQANSLGGPATDLSPAIVSKDEENETEYSVSIATYLARDAHDYVNPSFTMDHDWLHLEARYNYEAIKTGSIFVGYNFSIGEKLAFEVTPMLGGVFGDITGIAPGYTISVSYGTFELYTQGEYFIDAGSRDANFFYNWSEFSCSPSSWFRFGLVLDRTKALGSNFEIRRGPFVGFKYRNVDLTTYWLSPGSTHSTFVFAATLNF